MLSKIKNKLKNKLNISIEDYQKYGCPKCNNINPYLITNFNDYTYKKIMCPNCKEKFTLIGVVFQSDTIINKHPNKRNAIIYKTVDNRPDNKEEDYCELYKQDDNIITFKLNSQQAGLRVLKMFNSINTNDITKIFNVKIDYLTEYPNTLLIVECNNNYKTIALINNIIKNNNKINYKLIKKVNDMEINFKSLWQEVCLFSNIFNLAKVRYIKSNLIKVKDDIAYYNSDCLFKKNDIMGVYESFGTYAECNNSIINNELDKAAKCILHYLSNIETNYFKTMFIKNENNYDNIVRNNIQNDFLDLLNTYYNYNNNELEKLKINNINLDNIKSNNIIDNKVKENFNKDYYHKIKPLLNILIDENIIKKTAKYVNEDTDQLNNQEQEKSILLTYLLYGFELQMIKELNYDNYNNAYLAIEYLLLNLNSPYYKNYIENINNNELKKDILELKDNLSIIYKKYQNNQNINQSFVSNKNIKQKKLFSLKKTNN